MERSGSKPLTSVAAWTALIGSWFGTYIATRMIVREGGLLGFTLPPDTALWIRVAIALIPIIPAILTVLAFVRDIRNADEFERRLHLEALAFAFPATLLLVMTLGLLELAIDLNAEDWSYRHIWPYLTLFWLFGYLQARSRYGVK